MNYKNTLYCKLEILIPSCDAYNDVWQYFFYYLHKNWNNCPLKINLSTNFLDFKYKNTNIIKTGKDISWSDNLLIALSKIESNYVLILIEDLIFKNKISDFRFQQILNWIEINKPNYLKLTKSSNPRYIDDIAGDFPKSIPYKASLMPSIWRKKTLENLIVKGESAWDFEIYGSKRAEPLNGFYCLNDNFINYNNSIIKGKWQKKIYDDLKIKNSSRLKMNFIEQLVYDFKTIVSKIFNMLPFTIKKIIKF